MILIIKHFYPYKDNYNYIFQIKINQKREIKGWLCQVDFHWNNGQLLRNTLRSLKTTFISEYLFIWDVNSLRRLSIDLVLTVALSFAPFKGLHHL